MSEISRKAEGMPGVNLCWTSIPSRGGVVILLVTSCHSNWDKLWLNWLFDLSADCTLLPLIMFWWLTTVCDAYFFSGRTQKEALEDGKKIQRPDLQVKRYELFFTTKVMLLCISLLLSAWRRSLNLSQNIMNLKIWLKGIQIVFHFTNPFIKFHSKLAFPLLTFK